MINEKYSYKDFMGQDFSSVSASELDNTEIVGSCFYQEGDPDAEIFPPSMTGVIFKRCNLDNVKVPAGNTVESSCCHRKIKAQNDLEDWFVDSAHKPVEPMRKADYLLLGISIDPADIPTEKMTESIVAKKEAELEVIS
jgi:hypothetical protein